LRAPLSRLHFHLASAPPSLRDAVGEEIREMERMIEVTLDFVENEIRPMIHEPIDLSMLVESVAEDFADVGKDVEVIATEPATIVGDPMLLKRLFANLIENAIKYGQSASMKVEHRGSNAIITVSDDGKGMSEEELNRAFEPFYRGEPSRNRKTGGVGLGLSIVKSAADAHGGMVELSNKPAGGLTVTVVLPLAGEAHADA